MNQSHRAFRLITWSLLSLWVFFGGLELAEQLQVIPEVAAEDQERQDLDQEALAQLASGLKPDIPALDGPRDSSVEVEATEVPISVSLNTLHQVGSPVTYCLASLRLHQRLSVYLI